MVQENSIHRYLRKALVSLSNPFAQLVFLSSLRDPYTGQYLHEGWASFSSRAEVHEAVCETHQQIFESVARLSLIALSVELRKHFESTGEGEARTANLWLETEPYYQMVPEGCSFLSRKFFISQVRFALEILVQAPTWSCLEEPTSSPLQQPALPLPPHFLN
jgi:hypothetical protein